MPKRVDYDERRRHIGDAVLRLIATRGVEAASVRTVAAEAGVSPGAVQHYFTTKAEMLGFALAHSHAQLVQRALAHVAARKPTTSRAGFQLFCTLLIPLDEDSSDAARVWQG